ncbi:YczE/YyaS/YitT family protein [Bacillus sp. DJP31]|uniref:YczE/YyaS/YitT family protein n=1 Tax=Bacillus sp. DJP31 TaxID=3409789 RepID=UPI003BB51189
MKYELRNRVPFLVTKWSIFLVGLVVMAFGIVLMIKADIGSAPWDVLHIGLYKQLGLSIGTWSIIAGFFVLFATSILAKEWPQLGAFFNMVLVGVFIDLFMMLSFIQTPQSNFEKIVMLIVGIIIIGYGIGLYISAKCGAGPRDTLMLVLTKKTGWKVQHIRGAMEVVVLSIGFLLDGPVFIGTFIFCFSIGPIVGFTLPQCEKLANKLMTPKHIETSITPEIQMGE